MQAARARLLVALIGVIAIIGCASNAPASPSASAVDVPAATPSAVASGNAAGSGSMVIVGRIVTMAEPPVAEALLIEDGTVTAVGARDEVLELAGDEVPVVDLGEDVAYPGFIDAHAHWIGDRDYYGIDSPAAAMDAAISRGWTSISEQWVNQERIDELTALAADDALPLRVDAYLALNFGDEFFGDWYASREPGPVGDALRVRGVKIHVDNGEGSVVNWTPDDLTKAVGQANGAGWQVSAHAVSTEAVEMLLDAYEAAIGPTGPNPLAPPDRARDPGVGRPAGPHGGDGPRHRDPPRRGGGRLGHVVEVPGARQSRQPRRRDGLARPLARLHGRRAACCVGDRHALVPQRLHVDR